MTLAEAVQWAEDHLFDRVLSYWNANYGSKALERGRGESFSVGELKEFTRKRPYLRRAEYSQ